MFKNKKLNIIIAAMVVIAIAAGTFFVFFASSDEFICEDNLKFIKSIDTKVQLTFLAEPEDYINGGMDYDAERYGINYVNGGDELHNSYYEWTVDTVKKYAELNHNIELKFIKFQSKEYKAIEKKYPDHVFYYGDIFVTAKVGDYEKMQVVNYLDIYSLIKNGENGSARIGSNDIETALSSAIATVISAETKKVGVITGHTSKDVSKDFEEFLLKANYGAEIINDTVITQINKELNAVIIVTPEVDFTVNEIAVLEDYLENGGLLDKGLLYFASPDTAKLPNLSAFLEKWGLRFKEGTLFEDTVGNFIEGKPTVIGTYPTGAENEITHMAGVCIVGNNAVMEKAFETKNRINVTELFTTPQTTSIAPVGSGTEWKADDKTKGINYLATSISQKTAYVNNKKCIGNVIAFSTLDFFIIPETEFTVLGNRDVVEEAVKQVTNYKNEAITFIPKIIVED